MRDTALHDSEDDLTKFPPSHETIEVRFVGIDPG